MSTITMKITGMHCDGCAARIKSVLEKDPGVRKASVSYPAGTAEISFRPQSASEPKLVEIIERAGFKATPV